MSNNNPNNTPGQVNIPFPAIPAAGSTIIPPNGGWYVFQTTAFPGVITVDGSGVAAVAPIKEKKINKDGCHCKKCKELYPYADPPDPEKFVCYSCRHYY